MSQTMYLATLTDILVEMGIAADSLTPETRLRADLQLDSTETVEVALQIKRRLGVNIKLEARQDFTLAQVDALIANAAAVPGSA